MRCSGRLVPSITMAGSPSWLDGGQPTRSDHSVEGARRVGPLGNKLPGDRRHALAAPDQVVDDITWAVGWLEAVQHADAGSVDHDTAGIADPPISVEDGEGE